MQKAQEAGESLSQLMEQIESGDLFEQLDSEESETLMLKGSGGNGNGEGRQASFAAYGAAGVTATAALAFYVLRKLKSGGQYGDEDFHRV